MSPGQDTARVAIITGASGGLGSATARALSRQGFHLVLMSRKRYGVTLSGEA